MIAVDTNILLYACDHRDASKQQLAVELVESADHGVLLWQVACEFIAASRKLGPQGFTAVQAWERLRSFLILFPLVTPSPGLLERARFLHVDRQMSFWDAMMVGACLDAGVDLLYTEDTPGAEVQGLQVINPFATV